MRQPMSRADRAKQFMPFAALKGYEEAVKESEKRKKEKIILAEDRKEELDFKLRQLKCGDEVTIFYFDSGEYRKVRDRFIKADDLKKKIVVGKKEIYIENIMEIE